MAVASLNAVRLGVARSPDQVRWRDVRGGLLGGIGFTVSLFVASLASGVAGYSWLRVMNRARP